MKQKTTRRSAPKKLQAIQTSRHLHVTHRRHTGRVLPRHSTSYPMLAMILLCVGVLLCSWTRLVTASTFGTGQGDYTVHTSVKAPVPTQAATIDTPLNNALLTATPTHVTGSCPVNTYVEILRNNIVSGVVLCQPTGKYDIQIDLFRGANRLVARVYSVTDDVGPDSPVTTVRLVRKTTNATTTTDNGQIGSTSTPQSAQSAAPLLLTMNFTYQGFYTGQQVDWPIDVEGGSAPYAVAVDWGDNEQSLISRNAPGVFTASHVYKKAGGYRGNYTIKITTTDAAGNQTFLQSLVIINNQNASAAVGTAHATGLGYLFGSNTPNGPNWRYIWPSYGLVVLMVASFWLGERREQHTLKPYLKKTRHRHA